MNQPNSATAISAEDLEPGLSRSFTRRITQDDARVYAAVSGDSNPVHLDPAYAASTPFGKPVLHGMFLGSLISALIANHLPGPGSIYRSQSLRFHKAVYPGDELRVSATVENFRQRSGLLKLDCEISNQNGETVLSGAAEVVFTAPAESASSENELAISINGEPYQHG